MRVVFVTRESDQMAGARVRCHGFARELRRNGIDARVFSFADDLGAWCGEREFGMSAWRRLVLNWRAFQRLSREPRDTVFVLQRVNYHVLAPLVLAWFWRRPFIFDCDDWNIRENPVYHFGFYPSSKMEFITRLVAKHAAACVMASRFLAEYFKPFSPAQHLIPTGVDTEILTPVEPPLTSEVVFSWVGTAYHPEMGDNLRFLLECFSSVADECAHARLSLAGEGAYFDSLRAAVASHPHKDKITMHAWIPAGKIPEHLAAIDVGLLPLTQDTKFNRGKSPTKLFEYMSMAKATVVSRIGEAEHIIQHGQTGFLAGTKAEFIQSMKALANDKDLALRLGRQARAVAEEKYSLRVLGIQLANMVRAFDSGKAA